MSREGFQMALAFPFSSYPDLFLYKLDFFIP